MHFLPFFSTILATAVLIASEPSAQSDSFEIAASDVGTSADDISKLPSSPSAGNMDELDTTPGAVTVTDTELAGLPPTAGRQSSPAPRPGSGQQQQAPSSGGNPYGGQQQGSTPGSNPYGQQQQGPTPGSNPYGQQQQSPVPDESTRPPAGYRGNQHCQDYGGCPFQCHTDCVCWEWCKNANCNLAPFGEQALTSAQISCDPSAGEKFIGKVCRPYCANWCEDMKNQITQSLASDQAQRAFLSRPLECNKNYYNCPGGPNPSGYDCLTPSNPLAPGSSVQYKELDKGDAIVGDSWRK